MFYPKFVFYEGGNQITHVLTLFPPPAPLGWCEKNQPCVVLGAVEPGAVGWFGLWAHCAIHCL